MLKGTLEVLRGEQANPASYWSRLSHDVVDHYLVEQYTHLWMVSRQPREEVLPPEDWVSPANSPIVFEVDADDYHWIFYGLTGDVRGKGKISWSRDSRYFSWYRYQNQYFVLRFGLYIFAVDPKPRLVSKEERRFGKQLFLTSQDQLIEMMEHNMLCVVLRFHGTTRTQPIPVSFLGASDFAIDHGLLYSLTEQKLQLYNIDTGELFHEYKLVTSLKEDFYDIFLLDRHRLRVMGDQKTLLIRI